MKLSLISSSVAYSSALLLLLLSTTGVDSFTPSNNNYIPTSSSSNQYHGSINHNPNDKIYNAPNRMPLVLPTSTTTTMKTQRRLEPVLNLFGTKTKETEMVTTMADPTTSETTEFEMFDEEKKFELLLLGVWGVSISAFILINNFTGPWPLVLKTVPERWFFLSHMVGGMLFGGGIILTTCIERLVAKSSNAPVLQFWFDKVPILDGLIVVPALTISMVSGTGLSIVRYGGLNVAPPHVGAIFWTLIAFMVWWAVTDLTTQGTALAAVNEMYDKFEDGQEELETPKVVVDRHVSNVVSCFFVLLLYSMMVLKPGTLFPFPWNA